MNVNNKLTRKKYQKLALLNNLSGITNCLNITIKQYALLCYEVEYYMLKIFLSTTLQDFSDVLRRKSKIEIELVMRI